MMISIISMKIFILTFFGEYYHDDFCRSLTFISKDIESNRKRKKEKKKSQNSACRKIERKILFVI